MRASCDIVGMVLLVSCAMFGQDVRAVPRPAAVNALVTPVVDESWLKHIGRPFEITSMGRTWELGPNTTEPGEVDDHWQMALPQDISQTTILTGSDIYRLNCRACHREAGTGFVPEINSLIDPVRATSPVLIIQRMKNAGMNMSHKQAGELARQAQTALLQRIHSGGEEMPPFAYLSEAEVRLLIAYLRRLAGIPSASSNQLVVRESPVQVGERIVKSLCHICHDATGPNPTPEQLEAGAIPPLSSLVGRTSLLEFVRKVTHGAPILMGHPATPHTGRMPVLDYLTRDEVAGVYFYLVLYPPQQPQVHEALLSPLPESVTVAGSQSGNDTDPPAVLSITRSEFAPEERGDIDGVIFLIGVVSLAAFLLAGGAVLTIVCTFAAGQSKNVEYVRRAKTFALRLRRPVTVTVTSDEGANPRTDEVA